MLTRTALTLTLLATLVSPAAFGQPVGQPPDHAGHMAQPTGAPVTLSADTRVLVHFPEPMREHTLANMRDHLTALAEIQEHLAAHRYERAADIAEQRLGMSSLTLHGAHEVAQYMPDGMRAAGMDMHRAASQFALTVQEAAVGNNMDKSVAALATLTQACVACHTGYRLR